MVLFWNLFNLLLLLGVMRILVERPQLREEPRLPTDEPVTLVCGDGRELSARLRDISARGARLVVSNHSDSAISLRAPLTLQVPVGRGASLQRFNVALIEDATTPPRVGLRFTPQDSDEKNRVIAFSMANSDRWVRFQRRRTRPMGYLSALARVLSIDPRPLGQHAISAINRLYSRMEKLWTTA
ncbi:MAG: PilZ domain-containing protein [Halioglobus sp.]|nr:PilZ domain-containing protein [Halioglobus sp.]